MYVLKVYIKLRNKNQHMHLFFLEKNVVYQTIPVFDVEQLESENPSSRKVQELLGVKVQVNEFGEKLIINDISFANRVRKLKEKGNF